MKKIKDYIIRHLGGYTAEEAEQIKDTFYDDGRWRELIMLQAYMKGLNGMPANQWASSVWNHVNKLIDNLKKEVTAM